jgi:putative ABC transport system permease protein
METTLRDIQYGFRMLRKNAGFTVIAVIALTLGIASTTVIASVINGVLLRPPPYPDGEHIVTIAQSLRATRARRDAVSPANFLDWQKQSNVFVAMAASRGWQGTLTEGDAPERLRVTMASASLFRVFAVNPLLGRTLQTTDEQPSCSNVCVLSQELWERRFGSDRGIIGREIRFDGQPRTVVGVMPKGFSPDDYAELWVPSPFGVPTHSLRPNQDPRPSRDSNFLDAYARLKPGVTLARAQAQMSAIMARLEKDYPNENKGEDIVITPLSEDRVGGLRPALLMLGGAVGFLLLIGCANVANLQLARAAGRSREVSIRAALGADRKRLVRQLLTESILLSLIGGALGLVLAAWTAGADGDGATRPAWVQGSQPRSWRACLQRPPFPPHRCSVRNRAGLSRLSRQSQ